MSTQDEATNLARREQSFVQYFLTGSAEKVQELRQELNAVIEDIAEKKKQMRSAGRFSRFSSKKRKKSGHYTRVSSN